MQVDFKIINFNKINCNVLPEDINCNFGHCMLFFFLFKIVISTPAIHKTSTGRTSAFREGLFYEIFNE